MRGLCFRLLPLAWVSKERLGISETILGSSGSQYSDFYPHTSVAFDGLNRTDKPFGSCAVTHNSSLCEYFCRRHGHIGLLFISSNCCPSRFSRFALFRGIASGFHICLINDSVPSWRGRRGTLD